MGTDLQNHQLTVKQKSAGSLDQEINEHSLSISAP
jgi:hypothetical protein